MKFDIRWGYNNIWIKEGNEWKAVFLIPQGLFEPLVMFFSLTNLLATFQAMMNEIFRMEVAQGWLSVYMDNITIHIKPVIASYWRFKVVTFGKKRRHNEVD